MYFFVPILIVIDKYVIILLTIDPIQCDCIGLLSNIITYCLLKKWSYDTSSNIGVGSEKIRHLYRLVKYKRLLELKVS